MLGKRPALVELQGQSDETKLRFLMPEPIGSTGWFFRGKDFHFDLPQIITCYGRFGIVMLISHKIHIYVYLRLVIVFMVNVRGKYAYMDPMGKEMLWICRDWLGQWPTFNVFIDLLGLAYFILLMEKKLNTCTTCHV